MLDFDKIKNIVSLAEEVYVYLNTVDKGYTVTQNSKEIDLVELMDFYNNTEIKMNQLPFEQLYLTTEKALLLGTKIIETFDKYLKFSPANILKLTEEFFAENSLIVAGKDRSGSLEIRSVDRLFIIEEGKLELAINSYSQTHFFTEDIQYWTVAIAVKKAVLNGVKSVVIHQHITYGNGYLANVPFHNTKDKSN